MNQKVRNAADPKQVKEAAKDEFFDHDSDMVDLKYVLRSPQGRRTLWRILTKCGVYRSVMTGNSQIYYLAGKQDLGHWLMADIIECDEDSYLKMMKENKEKLKENANV